MKRSRPNPLNVKSLEAALAEFLSAPATGGHYTNDMCITSVMGARGISARDCAGFDAARERYGRPRACTFREAFKACWGGSRNWRDFDLETLQECNAEFRHLQLPERVQRIMDAEDEAAYYLQSDDPF